MTGGAGFIGFELVKALLKSCEKVYIYDNFSGSDPKKVLRLSDERVKLVVEDLKRPRVLREIVNEVDVVFHLAANPDVKASWSDTKAHLEDNVLATYNLLEELKKSKKQPFLVFTSSSTVYGEKEKSVSEDEACFPISVYGAAKLACEALISGYVGSGLIRSAVILRLANIVGGSSSHGVVVDFVNKLKTNPNVLEVYGDGTQKKSYLHVSDTVDALLLVERRFRDHKGLEVFNVGSEDTITVNEIAQIVCSKMALEPEIRYLNQFEGRGWRGDVKHFHLDTKKLRSLGWSPKNNSKSSIEKTVEELLFVG